MPVCIICGGTTWRARPAPGPCSMASDWRVLHEPLTRLECVACGLASRPPWSDVAALFESGYTLYAHAPGDAREQMRQDEYARWIAAAVSREPATVLDVGCGNGSLLRAFRRLWPSAALMGCDPSGAAIAHGAGDGLTLWRGTAADLPEDVTADLVVAVNVIEHTTDPVTFIDRLRDALAPAGRLVIVCPDGGRPGLDLLFADHLFSFASAHLAVLLARAGLDVASLSAAPTALGPFQMIAGTRTVVSPLAQRLSLPRIEGRAGYLERWQQLDDRLSGRLERSVVCFGTGEAAGLLRAYAPRSWAMVRACTADVAVPGRFGTLPVIPLDAIARDATLLLGVRPQDQPHVAQRLRSQFARVVAWYDLVDGDQHL